MTGRGRVLSGPHRRWGGAVSAVNSEPCGGEEFPEGEFTSPEDSKKKGPQTGASPVGRHDHAMDEIRYFAATVAAKEGNGGWFAGSVARRAF